MYVSIQFPPNTSLAEQGEGSFTLNGSGTNADVSTFKFHQNRNTVFDSAGVPKLDFSKTNCR